MSYIDTIAHEFVGTLAGYPVYHPTTTRAAVRGANDFGCSPMTLVLGGGSGEHPGLVVHRLDELVARYVLERLDAFGENSTGCIDELPQELLDLVGRNFETCFEFCGWGIEHFQTFANRCAFGDLPVPYSSLHHTSVEHWLACVFGEYVFVHRPDLMGERLALLLNERRAAQVAELRTAAPAFPNLILTRVTA